MKIIVVSIFFSFCLFYNLAGQEVIPTGKFLFDESVDGVVLFKNKTQSRAKFNYNKESNETLFLDKDQWMTLQEMNTIDTIYMDGRRFIPYSGVLLEVLSTEGGNVVYVDWRVSVFVNAKGDDVGSYVSKVGGTDALNLSSMQQGPPDVTRNVDYKYKNNNSYYFMQGIKFKRFNTTKGFLKLYPKEFSEAIQKYANEQKINIQKPENVCKLVDYAQSLQK